MNNLFRGLLAGYGAHKLGGGCISTVLIFIVLWWLLGTCGDADAQALRTNVGTSTPAALVIAAPPAIPAARWP